MTIVGTCHFVSRNAAYKYYAGYGLTAADVALKIAAREIAIGPPKVKGGEAVILVDGDTRYAVVS